MLRFLLKNDISLKYVGRSRGTNEDGGAVVD